MNRRDAENFKFEFYKTRALPCFLKAAFFSAVFFLFVLLTCPAFSDEMISSERPEESVSSPITISIQSGVINGTISELVYDQGRKISEIKWDLKPLYLSGFAVHSRFLKQFRADFSYGFGTNSDLGHVEDSDFDKDTGVKTRFSKHDSELEKAHFTDLKLGASFFKNDPVQLILGYGFWKIKLAATDGNLEYPPGAVAENVYGIGITYDQIYSIPYLGIVLRHFFSQRLESALSAFYSSRTNIETIDSHFKRNMDFYDKMKGAIYYAIEPSIRWRVSRGSSLLLSTPYTRIAPAIGESFSFNTSTGEKSAVIKNGAGIGFASYGVFLSWEVAIW